MVSFWSGKKVIVTGGSGFIGSFIAEMLVDEGAIVTVTSRPKSDTRNINHLQEDISIKRGNLLDYSFVDSITSYHEYIFHVAALKKKNSREGLKTPTLIKHNTEITTNVLDAAVANNINKVFIMSSSSASKVKDVGFNMNGYAWSKKISEVFSQAYSIEYDLPVVIARPPNTYGPRDDFSKGTAQIIPSFIRRVVNKKSPLKVWGNGEQKKPFVYVKDVARGALDIMEKCDNFRPIDFTSDELVSINNLARLIMEIVGEKLEISYDTTKPIIKDEIPGTFRSCGDFKFSPSCNLREGLKETIQWYKNST